LGFVKGSDNQISNSLSRPNILLTDDPKKAINWEIINSNKEIFAISQPNNFELEINDLYCNQKWGHPGKKECFTSVKR
jgi:hypothetical protein